MRLVGRLVIQLISNAVGLVVAAATLDGVSLTAGALLLDAVLYTAVAVVALPMIQKQALRRSEALAGSSALVTSLIALVVTALLSDGLRIRGFGAWVAATVIVWAVALAVGVLLPWLLVRRKVRQRRNAGPSPTVHRP